MAVEDRVGSIESIPVPAIQAKDQHQELPEIDENWEQIVLESCQHCSRTFLPERLEIHQRSCKADRPLKRRTAAD